MIDHRLYKEGELTRVGENFAIAQQERLEEITDEDRAAELEKIQANLAAEMGSEEDAAVVMAAIVEFIESVDEVFADF